MSIKYSTGRGARVRHSTALEWDDLEKAKKKYSPIKYSTGEKTAIRHATGVEFDYKYLAEKEKEKVKAEGDDYLEEFKEPQPIRSRVRSKAKVEGEEYLEKFHEITRKAKK